MSMVTRCPSCATTFRVTPQHLQSHGGQVRCGRCTHIFDAFAHLATLPEEADSVVQHDLEKTPVAAVPVDTSEIMPTPAPEPTMPTETLTSSALDFESHFLGTTLKKRRWPWAIGILLLLIFATIQGVYWFRTDLAAHYPPLKTPLQRLCVVLQCTVDLPQHADMLDIEASDLQPENPSKPNLLVFAIGIRNRSLVTQAYPTIELTLTNAQNNVVARRVFTPKDYLNKDQNPQTGIPAKAEISLRLNLDIGELAAAGYRAYLFYP